MNYEQLGAFVAVASEGSFTAASARLHKSQPAVSKLVRGLELELGVDLFDRRAYRASLTDAGKLFYERATTLIESTEALRAFGRELAGDVEPIVRIAVDAVTPLAGVLDVLRATQARFPSVRLELRTERLSGAVQVLLSGDADIGVATLHGVDARGLQSRPFAHVRIVPVARVDHALAREKPPIPAAMLRAHAQIVLRDSAQGESASSLNVLDGGVRWTVTDVACKQEIIAAGMGWGGLPEHLVASELARGKLVALDVPEFVDTMHLFAVRRRDRPHGVVARALWAALTADRRGSGASLRRRRRSSA